MRAKFIYEGIKHLKPKTGPDIEEYLEKIKNFTPDGYFQLNNWGGMEIQYLSSNDGILWRYNFGGDEKNAIGEAEIEYEYTKDEDQVPFFIAQNTKYYLADFMRVDRG